MTTDVREDTIAEGSGPHELSADEAIHDDGAETVMEPGGLEATMAEAEGDGDGDGDEVAVEADAAELPQALDDAQLKRLVEALVFAAEKPVTVARLRQLTRVAEVKRIEAALALLTEDYRDRGLALQCISGGYQFRTATQFSSYVQQLVAGRPVRLSRAQLETLAIVAYRQPITRPEIDDIRGVDSSNTLRVLSERSLVRILGKKEEVGRPLLYGTTKEFLDFFSLNDLRELPTLREYSELSAESRQVMTAKLGERAEEVGADVAPADEPGGTITAADVAVADGPDADALAADALAADAADVLAADAASGDDAASEP